MERVLENRQRIDIQYTKYRRVAAAHVIVELKRRSVKVKKTELEQQVKEYMKALKDELATSDKDTRALPMEAVCIVGDLPQGWKDEETRKEDERSLEAYRIRVITYDELIDNAYVAYGKFIKASADGNKLQSLLNQIRTFEPNAFEEGATI